MLSYCLKGKRDTQSKTQRATETRNVRATLLSNCVMYNSKKSRFIREQEVKWAIESIRNQNSFKKKTIFRRHFVWRFPKTNETEKKFQRNRRLQDISIRTK